MNEIQLVEKAILQLYPTAKSELYPPLHPDGFWSLEIDFIVAGAVTIEWRDAHNSSFGLSSELDELMYGESSSELYDSQKALIKRIKVLNLDDTLSKYIGSMLKNKFFSKFVALICKIEPEIIILVLFIATIVIACLTAKYTDPLLDKFFAVIDKYI